MREFFILENILLQLIIESWACLQEVRLRKVQFAIYEFIFNL